MSSPNLVDDTNPAVQYAPGWIWDQMVAEVDGTRHGAGSSGLTASLGFSGAGIKVVGTLQASDTSGQPTTTYAIDGVQLGTYTAPFTPSGVTHYNVTFFSKLDLSQGDHEITITNTNGTSPNIFWLDYFLVYPTASPAQDLTTSSTSAPAPPTTTSHSTSLSSISTTTSTPPPTTTSSSSSSSLSFTTSTSSTSATDTSTTSSGSSTTTTGNGTLVPFVASGGGNSITLPPSSSTGSASSTVAAAADTSSDAHGGPNIAAIVGGIVGGLLLIALGVLGFIIWRKRRRAREDIDPFVNVTPQQLPSPDTSMHSGYGWDNPNKMAFNASALVSRPPIPQPSSSSPPQSVYPASTASELVSGHRPYGVPVIATMGAQASVSRHAAYPFTGFPADSKEGPGSSSSPTLSPTAQRTATSESMIMSPASSALSPTPTVLHNEVSQAPWYAHAQSYSRAQSLLRAFTSRTGPAPSARTGAGHDVDSGLRLYSEATLPPPYTAD